MRCHDYAFLPALCDEDRRVYMPREDARERTCRATGKRYWTLAGDPDHNCPKHEYKEAHDAAAVA